MSPPPDLTQLLCASSAGDPQAAEELLPAVYDELRALAARRLREERLGHTLEPTALVHEAYLRLVDADRVGFNDRQHFFATAARTIRRVLIDHARARGAERRGGGAQRCTLTAGLLGDEPEQVEWLDLEAALTRLEAASPRHAQVVQLRWFAGFDVAETASTLGVSVATVKNDWRAARACLRSWIDASA